MMAFRLLDENRPQSDSFIGHITDLSEEQNYAPFRFFARYNFTDVWGVEAAWNSIEAEAINSGAGTDPDGAIKLSGPSVMLNARWESVSAWTPFAGIGAVFFDGDFEHEDWHHYGYESKADWKSLGSPKVPRHGKGMMTIDDPVGFIAALGADYALTPDWSLEIYGAYTKVEIEDAFTVSLAHQVVQSTTRDFPMDSLAMGVGVRHSF